MTGIEIAAVVVIVVFAFAAVVFAMTLIALLAEEFRRSRRRRRTWNLTNLSIRVTREPVHVGEKTDIRFYFTVDNPDKESLHYDARLDVEDFAAVPQQNSFSQDSLTTFVPRLSASWNSPGARTVSATVTVTGGRHTAVGKAEGQVHVLGEDE